MNVTGAPLSGRIYTDSLVEGPIWDGSSLTFAFPTAASQFTGYGDGEPFNNFETLNPAQQAAVRAILGSIAGFTNLAFSELTGTGSASAVLRFGMTDALNPSAVAHAYLPLASEKGGDSWYRNTGGENDSPVRGNDAWHTFLHEVGHTLGLGHPHEASGAEPTMPADRDFMAYTVMSYRSALNGNLSYGNETWGFAQSYMMEDIAALQFLYGANFNYNDSNTVYRWNPATGEMSINGVGQGAPGGNRVFMTLWDGGGTDTYDFSNYTGDNATIELRSGTWTRLPGGQTALLGGYNPGNIANALLFNNDPRSLIENAIGTAGNDTIRGNQVANQLSGGAGSDKLEGFEGADTLLGEGGSDQLFGGDGNDSLFGGDNNDALYGDADDDWLDGGADNDSLRGGAGNDTLFGAAGDDALEGNEGNDTLDGGDGADTLDGTVGDDTLIGGPGNDTYNIEDAGDQIIELEGGGYDVVVTPFSYVAANGIDRVRLTGFDAINATGNSLDNLLSGNNSANVLDGGAGADVMRGGYGNDTYYIDNPNDWIFDGGSAGFDTVYSSASFVLIERDPDFDPYAGASLRPWSDGNNEIELFVLTGSANLSATGNSAGNNIRGNSGDNVIDGGFGIDTMTGGGGNDTYVVDNVGDTVTENAGEGTDEVRTGLLSYSIAAFANVENLTGTGAAGQTLTGNNEANLIDGGLGDDSLSGGGGNDTYVVDSVGDTVTENAGGGTDEVRTGLLSYSIAAFAHVENLTGTGAAGQTLTGNSEANLIDGGLGDDSLSGGGGNDTYVVDSVGDTVTENAGGGTDEVRTGLLSYSIAAFANVENLTGTGAAGQTLTGNNEANLIDGGLGDDQMSGGDGNDTFVVDSLGDVVIETVGKGTDTVRTALGSSTVFNELYLLPDNVEALVATGSGQGLWGNALDNTLTGSEARDLLVLAGRVEPHVSTNEGHDTAHGAGGNDFLFFGGSFEALDVADGGSGTDTLGLLGNYTLTFGVGSLVGIEKLALYSSGNPADPYNYAITTHDGNVAAGQTLFVTSGTLQVGERLTFNGAAETNGSFEVLGGRDGDTLTGGAQRDRLTGNAGADLLTGGGERDTFQYNAVTDSNASGRDTILDFSSIDLIDLGFIDANTIAGGNQAFNFIGEDAFAGTGAASAGELRFQFVSDVDWLVLGDTDGNGSADFELLLHLTDASPITVTDFYL